MRHLKSWPVCSPVTKVRRQKVPWNISSQDQAKHPDPDNHGHQQQHR